MESATAGTMGPAQAATSRGDRHFLHAAGEADTGMLKLYPAGSILMGAYLLVFN